MPNGMENTYDDYANWNKLSNDEQASFGSGNKMQCRQKVNVAKNVKHIHPSSGTCELLRIERPYFGSA